MRLTKAEKEFILEKRRQEEEQKPKKIGFLKEDIYDFNGYSLSQDIRGCYYVSASLKDKMVTDFINSFTLGLKAGAKFVCFIEDNQEQWYDEENYGIEAKDTEWANERLYNITKIK
jgi:tRNA G10  N-methylase Trm11